MSRMTYAAAAAAVVLGAGAASAATFDFKTMSLDSSHQLTVDGVTVTAYAGVYRDFPNPDTIVQTDCSTTSSCDRSVYQGDHGLGVTGFLDGPYIDGFLGNDLLTLSFSQTVDFSAVLFSFWGNSDSFDLFVDGTLVSPEERSGPNPYPLSGLRGTSISFGADAMDDSYKLASITVAPVPLPAAGLMLLGGLGGLAAVGRRKKKS
ncbi:VPLPA-CTERM sorting domain-containing protein [Rhodovulum visakhapatnamense]|uniref:VPLPA-CTERM sorting domain-containing protein n=1 Tax=Rhodovulum visakhapatnamense TaxID=364297 RepID=A0ABS1RES0_9RHOB|nr:VPLPA-CTERM sorting domain-containing protein [Rhodovulum visakhapatnamense]MBL3568820.1 VPLPA-CTERM sorting domain-containing protein [Rhodovulum visakhapatnamense]MBL3578147.1 VPLPA-CTERM sorting domain-containing protein [Rhodovulum visakhapatnamense]